MNTILMPMTTRSLLLWLLICASAQANAATPAEALCRQLEQHLQSLKSLEISYEADGPGAGDESINGRIVWAKPDRFLHDTPDWTVCETGAEQWRFLKQQNTLIRERASEESEWRPEDVLFHSSSRFRPDTLEVQDDGTRVVTLHSEQASAPGVGILEFPADRIQPGVLTIRPPDGGDIRYVIRDWVENEEPDASLFEAPEVPPENLIDFRAAGNSK